MGMRSVYHMSHEEVVAYLKKREGHDFPAEHMHASTARDLARTALSRPQALVEALRTHGEKRELYEWVWKNHNAVYREWVGPENIPPDLLEAGD